MIQYADGSTALHSRSPESAAPSRRSESDSPSRRPETDSPHIRTDTEALGDEIARLSAHIHAATHRLLELIREFDEREGWSGGFRSCAHWLSWRTGVGPGAAREKVRVARALGELPKISAAMERGELSFSKARAMTRVATPENEDDLVELSTHATAAQIERIVRAWRRVDRLEAADGPEALRDSRHLRIFRDEDGMFVVRARLEPEVGAVLEKAVEWAEDQLYRGASEEERAGTTVGQRRADAVGLLAERALVDRADAEQEPAGRVDAEEIAAAGTGVDRGDTDRGDTHRAHAEQEPAGGASHGVSSPSPGGRSGGGRADRFQVILHISAETPGPESAASSRPLSPPPRTASPPKTGPHFDLRIPPGHFHVSAETSRRLACDAGLVLMSHDERGEVLDVGRKQRTVPAALRRALEWRDGGMCRFPGCEIRHVDAHHMEHWADGGHTRLDNLVLLCRRHHRLVHEEGWNVEWEARPSGTESSIVFRRPDGKVLPPVPPAPELPLPASNWLERANRARGVDPGSWAATPDWKGESLDLDFTILTLR